MRGKAAEAELEREMERFMAAQAKPAAKIARAPAKARAPPHATLQLPTLGANLIEQLPAESPASGSSSCCTAIPIASDRNAVAFDGVERVPFIADVFMIRLERADGCFAASTDGGTRCRTRARGTRAR
jgi:hypothetical protein